MSELTRRLAALLRVKTLVTATVMVVFAALSLRGALAPDVVMGVVTMVVAFYFGTQTERDAPDGAKRAASTPASMPADGVPDEGYTAHAAEAEELPDGRANG